MLNLDCRRVTHLLSEGLDRRLGLGERIALRFHFRICEGCRRFRSQMAFLRTAIRRLPDSKSDRP